MITSSDTITPRLPDIGDWVRTQGKLVAIEDVTPKAPPQEIDYVFEDYEAEIHLLSNGHEISRGPTINSFYGEDTCVELAIADAKELLVKYGDHLEAVIEKVTTQTRMRPIDRRNPHDKQFFDFARKETYSHSVTTRVKIWSSKHGFLEGYYSGKE